MARFTDDTINRIKQDISLLRLVEAQGYTLTKIGKDHAINCPFHDDDTPSLIISPKTNLYHCFGCDAAGSVIDWVMNTEKLDFRQAVEVLSERFSLAADLSGSSASKPVGTSKATKSAPTVEGEDFTASNDDQALMLRVIEYYHRTLKQNPEALEYLESRGLNDPELINYFKLGYANRSLGPKLPEKNRKAGAAIRTQLQKVGLLRTSGHEHFNGSLVVPVMAPMMGGSPSHCRITEVYGRKILNNLRKGTPKHLYLSGPHQGVFNVQGWTSAASAGAANSGCLQSDEIILCESLIDALTFWHWGFRNVTTSYGTGGFTDEIQQAFVDHGVKRVLIAYDRDEAGNKAAEKLAKKLTKLGMDCYRVQFPKGMDVNEYALKMTPARKSLELVIRKAEWLGAGADPRTQESQSEALAGASVSSLAASPQSSLPTSAELPASPIPESNAVQVDAEVKDSEAVIHFENRRYRVRGLKKATSYEQLKINLAVSEGDNLHVDQLDLYNAKHRQSYIKQAAIELGVHDDVIKKDLSKLLLKLEELQEEQIQEAAKPKEKGINLSSAEQEKALELLREPSLLSRILEDFNRAGVVGEETNKLVGYLAAVSRKLDNPLAVIVQSTSAAGKSALMNAVLAMIPEEEKIQYSAMTGQSLFYMGETSLKHKILAIAEEEGADQASYALKLLQSEGELTIASTGKDADGNLTTQEYHVEGPVMLFSTTTAIDIDEELMNRCIILTVNESREQTRLIHDLQRERETLEGLLANEDRKTILENHRNAQRLLRSLKVVNPYAKQLTFMDNQTRSRRDHMKYLRLMKTIALLHQYQRKTKTVQHNGRDLEYIEVELSDIAVANQLAHEVLGRSLDELPPQTRKLLTLIYEMVTTACEAEKSNSKDYHFSRKIVRECTGWGDTQLKIHLNRLSELEYLLIHRKGQQYLYEMQYQGEGESGSAFLMNLIDVKTLGYDVNRSGSKGQQSGFGRGEVGPQSGAGRSQNVEETPIKIGLNGQYQQNPNNHSIPMKNGDASCRTVIM